MMCSDSRRNLSRFGKIAVHCCAMKRRYELKERARRQAETKQRIVEAAVALHTSVGPARTTISAIAERAGVERHTVYAHFPDERTLFRACSTHWRGRASTTECPTAGSSSTPPRSDCAACSPTSTPGTRTSSPSSRPSCATRTRRPGKRRGPGGDRGGSECARRRPCTRLASAQARARRDRPRARVRDVALARPPAGPLAQAGGRRDAAPRRLQPAPSKAASELYARPRLADIAASRRSRLAGGQSLSVS